MAMAMSEVRESSNPESSHLSASPQWFGSIEILYIDYSRTYIEAYIHEREMVQWLIDARHFKDCSCIFSHHEFVRWKSSKFTPFSILRLFLIPLPAPHHQGPGRAYIHRWNLVRILRWPDRHQSTSIHQSSVRSVASVVRSSAVSLWRDVVTECSVVWRCLSELTANLKAS